ncbi:MAG: hypothetical protein GY749_11380 [Desulfobacteraceae bacterium]|nr:hypothetical protein [Desulfobacteraceae bacterium]
MLYPISESTLRMHPRENIYKKISVVLCAFSVSSVVKNSKAGQERIMKFKMVGIWRGFFKVLSIFSINARFAKRGAF